MSPKYVCPICLMKEHEHRKLIEDGNEGDSPFLAVKRIPVFIKRDKTTQIRFILTTIHEHCYESYMKPLTKNGLKNAAIRTPKIIDVFK